VQRLRANLHDLDGAPKNKHTLFVDDEKEAARFRSSKDFARHLQTPVELLGRAAHRPVSGGEGSGAASAPAPAAKARTKKEEKAKAKKYSELKQREQREGKLKAQLSKLRREKVVHAKGVKRKVRTAAEGQPRQFKFKQVRQR